MLAALPLSVVAAEVFKSPKSVALPTEAIVIYSILLTTLPSLPPPNTPLVSLDRPARALLAAVKFPKSAALPFDLNST